MGNATFFTAARMQQIEDSTVVAGLVDVNGHLLLKRRDDQTIDAGNVVGPQGPRGYNNLFDFWQLTNPTSTPPSGSISANTATLVNAETLYFHVMPEGGSSFEGLFRLLKSGSMISVQSAGTPANWAQFTTTSGFSFTGNVASVNVTLKDQAGASVSSERVAVMFTQPTAITSLNLPAGLVMANTLPTGYPEGTIPLEGQAISRTTYAALFAKYGTFYGAGDGSTTFNLPNYEGRTLVGSDILQAEFNTMGKKGGSKSHTHWQTMGYDGGNLFARQAGSTPVSASGSTIVITTPRATYAASQANALARFDTTEPDSSLQPYAVVQWVVTTGIGGGIYPASTGQMGKGTSAQRDGFYGVPTTDAQRVALANSVPVWFNTETGWEESYYTTFDKSGLTVRGLQSGSNSGWYPINRGPYLSLRNSADQSGIDGNGKVLTFDTIMVNRGFSLTMPINSTNFIQIPFAGVWRFEASCVVSQSVNGYFNLHLNAANNSAALTGSVFPHTDAWSSAYIQRLWKIGTGQTSALIVSSSTAGIVRLANTYFSAVYVGPALVDG